LKGTIMMRRMVLLLALSCSVSFAADNATPVSPSLANEARAALDRGVKWLVAKQAPDGSWSNPDFPALTALPAVGAGPERTVRNGGHRARGGPHSDRGESRRFHLPHAPGSQRKGGGLCNYNTAIAMVALNAVGRPELVPLIQKARAVIAGSQHQG
jgi:squalene-hopene/tetraprenyl-beta-curcumene cyclase